jgi:hypothetical protein
MLQPLRSLPGYRVFRGYRGRGLRPSPPPYDRSGSDGRARRWAERRCISRTGGVDAQRAADGVGAVGLIHLADLRRAALHAGPGTAPS